MRQEIINFISETSGVKYIFTDYFDTLVHRTVHPNYILRLWAKKLIEQFSIPLTIDELYFTRNEINIYLLEKYNLFPGEIPYDRLIAEIYKRLDNNSSLGSCESLEQFVSISKEIEYYCEFDIQYLNIETVETLKYLKEKGMVIYCVSDFYSDETLLKKLIEKHGLKDLFKDIYVSAERECSKHHGEIYPYLLEKLKIEANQVIMIGDNYKSDFTNAQKAGIKSFYIENKPEKRLQKRLRFGNDAKDYKKIIKTIYNNCNTKEAPPYSDYIIFFSRFTEKLYKECLDKKIKNIFFLAREGLYLKRLFDYYQEVNKLEHGHFVKTHYLKMSRLSALQITYKPFEKENFNYFREFFKDLSVHSFLQNFNFSDDLIDQIIQDLNCSNSNTTLINFFETDEYKKIRANILFKTSYEANRVSQEKGFTNYMASFNTPFKEEGITVVDVGWLGTMQDKIHAYYNGEVSVNGYYLGITQFRDAIQNNHSNKRKRGLIFEANLYSGFNKEILMSNTGIYEQLSQAPHGSTIGYQDIPDNYTIEYFDPSEKKIYEQYIKETQDFMFDVFKYYCAATKKICYTTQVADEIIVNYALKINTLVTKRKLKRFSDLSLGFCNSIGNITVGDDNYKLSLGKAIKKNLPIIRSYVISPEKLVKYVLLTKFSLFRKNKHYYIPTFPLYYYIRLNRMIKKSIRKTIYLKYSHFR
ncbi:HAD family hydrolase [Tamlana sp. 2_MG-2023]|uniref:HAD family hydrolase n=1 Tax=unclassified Tamlana TaxID=2614803 RepID=UPI0026E32773|nr:MULTISPECIES: HAD family hydrolase [unclassified Tamlana]MDO6759478.1 HAD family hydrolase [Tamlana sp. 2_MG-2023]MDO6790383.1 HAD family hydrolase [Tamlana sp. 1_MG-2023]